MNSTKGSQLGEMFFPPIALLSPFQTNLKDNESFASFFRERVKNMFRKISPTTNNVLVFLCKSNELI